MQLTNINHLLFMVIFSTGLLVWSLILGIGVYHMTKFIFRK